MPTGKTNERLYRLLIVEDNADDVELFSRVLQKVQVDLEIEIQTDAISDSAEAASRIMDRRFDMIFLDFNLPPPDGIELVRRIRGSQLNRTTPTVILTGASDRGLMTRAFQAGVNFFIFKPIDRRQLLRLMEVALVPIDRERRKLQRVKVKCKVAIETGQDRLDGETLDISLNGMLIKASRTLPVGSTVNLNLKLPQADTPLRMAARIIRIVGNEHMGVQLENVGKAESERLGEVLVPMIAAMFEDGR